MTAPCPHAPPCSLDKRPCEPCAHCSAPPGVWCAVLCPGAPGRGGSGGVGGGLTDRNPFSENAVRVQPSPSPDAAAPTDRRGIIVAQGMEQLSESRERWWSRWSSGAETWRDVWWTAGGNARTLGHGDGRVPPGVKMVSTEVLRGARGETP